MRGRLRITRLTVFGSLLFLILVQSSNPAAARTDGPVCPPGFHFEPSSGVGCVQTNCLTIPNAKYNAGQRCICLDNFHACTVPVDNTGVDCGPFCPPVLLEACVPADQPCPDAGRGPDSSQGGDADNFLDFLAGSGEPGAGGGEGISSLVSDLEEFLAGGNRSSPGSKGAAAGAASLTALLTAWVISQLLAGRPSADVIGAVSRWRQKSAGGPGVESKGNGKPDPAKGKQPEAMPETKIETKPETKTEAKKPPQQIEEAKPEPKKDPPPKAADVSPPDLPTLRRKHLKEKTEAQNKIDFLKQLQVLLDQEYRKYYTDWEVARRCAPVEGVIDIADIWLGLRGLIKISSVKGEYGKDLLKRSIKGLFSKWVRYRQDGSFELTPKELASGAYKSLGLKSPPGGAFKKVITNLMKGKGVAGYGKFSSTMLKTFGGDLAKVYGTEWKIRSLLDNTTKQMVTTEDLRQKMTNLRDLFNMTQRDLESAQTDLDLANSALKKVDSDIQELKKAFPKKFRDL